MNLPPERSLLLHALTRLCRRIADKCDHIDAQLVNLGLSDQMRSRLQAGRDELREALRRSEELARRLDR